MKELQQWAAVQELVKRKVPFKQISRELHMSKNTVKKLARLKEAPCYHREIYHSKLDPYKEQIIIWRCQPFEFNGTRIFNELLKIGYQGSQGPVYRYLSKLDEDIGNISSKATERTETPVGDQAQFDWSEYDIVVNNIERKVYCFSLILAACRKKAICFSLKVDAEAIYEAIQELFEDLGGVTLELLIDNPKALVIDNNPQSEDEIRYNPEALLLAKHLGTELNACPCYWPRKKGKVEKPFQYIEEQFVKGSTFDSMEDLNRKGKAFIKEWNGKKHTTTQRVPNEFYELEEREALLPLPNKRYRLSNPESRLVSNDCVISYKANKYSVPCRYAGKQVQCLLLYGFRLIVTDLKGNLLCSWELVDGKRNVLVNNEHIAEIATKVSTSIPQIRRIFTETFQHGRAFLEAADNSATIQQPTHHARKILLLLDLYDVAVLDGFIAYAVENGILEFTKFKKLLKEHTKDIKAPVFKPEVCSKSNETKDDYESGILRSCSYYENFMKEVNTDGR